MHSKNKILHIFGWDKKFCPQFIEFVREHFEDSEHCYIIHGVMNEEPLPIGSNVVHYPNLLAELPCLLRHIRSTKKVILHGLFSSHLMYALMLQPWLLKKCYWTIWGGDLYLHDTFRKDWRFWKNEIIRRFVIGRIGHFITHIKGDFELAKQWYGARGEWHECFMYPSNLYRDLSFQVTEHDGINLLVGNSADPSNNHKEVLDKLSPYAQQNIKIYCPLSYGNQTYAREISDYGKSIFGDKFVGILDFMLFDKYLKLLGKIDIAIFNHDRQQGMGNITTLLGFRKKVYMQRCVTSYQTLRYHGIEIFDVSEFELTKIGMDVGVSNHEITSKFFSESNLLRQLRLLFEVK